MKQIFLLLGFLYISSQSQAATINYTVTGGFSSLEYLYPISDTEWHQAQAWEGSGVASLDLDTLILNWNITVTPKYVPNQYEFEWYSHPITIVGRIGLDPVGFQPDGNFRSEDSALLDVAYYYNGQDLNFGNRYYFFVFKGTPDLSTLNLIYGRGHAYQDAQILEVNSGFDFTTPEPSAGAMLTLSLFMILYLTTWNRRAHG